MHLLSDETVVQANPNQLAVGADDQYVRLWDRRMLSTGMYTRVRQNSALHAISRQTALLFTEM